MRIALWKDWKEAWSGILRLLLSGATPALVAVMVGSAVGSLFSSNAPSINWGDFLGYLALLGPLTYFATTSLFLFSKIFWKSLSLGQYVDKSVFAISLRRFLSFARPVRLHGTLVTFLLGVFSLGPAILLYRVWLKEDDVFSVGIIFLAIAFVLDACWNRLTIARRFVWLFFPFLPAAKIRPTGDFPWFVEEEA